MGATGGFLLGVTGVNDNDELIDWDDAAGFDTFMLQSVAGAMDVFVSMDGSHFSTAPLSLSDLGATSGDPVLVTVAGRVYGFRGKFRAIKVLQNGATAVTFPRLSYTNF